MTAGPYQLARRYVAWVDRRRLAIIVAHVALLVGAVYLIATRLPLYADFSYLLPQDAPAVRDLRKLEARVKASEIVLVLVEAPDPAARAAVMAELAQGFEQAAPELIDLVDADDADLRAFLRAHRHLFVPLADLVRARDALARQLQRAKLKANPLYIDLEDADEDAKQRADDKAGLEELRAKRKDADARLARSSNVSPVDPRIGMIQVRTRFRATDAARGEQLLHALDGVRERVRAAHPGVTIGFTGSVVTAVAEHAAISRGIVLSGVITTLLVALVLALYFRSARLLVLLVGTLAVATAIAFGLAAITVGHLNAATAFLGAIIAGNGINYGILLIARYLEERRRLDVEDALARAITATLRPTAVAALGASIAYGSLAATSFKGFADFAVIGGVGMMVCWVATYVLFPAVLLQWARASRLVTSSAPLLGGALVRVIGFRRSRLVCIAAVIVSLACGAIVARYIAADPFEYDIKKLRSVGADAVAARAWMRVSDQNFGRFITGRTYIAADRPDQVPRIVAALARNETGVAPERRAIGEVRSIFDVVPEQQPEKLGVLADIRRSIDEILAMPADDPPRELVELRPPDTLDAITPDRLPATIKDLLSEKDGRVGLLVSVRPGNQLDEWNGHDLIRFADAVRTLQLDDGETVTTSGSSVIFADIIESIERDGPKVTTIAALALVGMVLLLVGRNRRAVAVLAGTAAGSLLMVAACALLGLRVNFLDFVALPITLGLGIDYAINVAHRHDHEDIPDPITTLRTSGSAVFVCSLTTMIGYSSLLVSDNLAIRGFGTASLIGEITCVLSALVLVPALLAVRQQSAPRRQDVGDDDGSGPHRDLAGRHPPAR